MLDSSVRLLRGACLRDSLFPSSFLFVQLLLDNLIYLLKRYRGEVIVIHSDIVLRRVQVLQPLGIQPRIILSGVDMTEELPNLPVTTLKAEEWVVTQIDPLLADSDMHLHRYMLKSADEALAQVLQVVIAEY